MRITGYDFGEIAVEGKIYRNDIIIHGEVITEWWRREGHLVEMEDLARVMEEKPPFLVIGTGYYGAMKVSPEVKAACKRYGIELIVEKTRDACRRYNELILKEKLNVSAAFHLTC